MTRVDPYALPGGPVAIQFSGGRTSGYMLRHILDRYDGGLPPDCHVLFQNTGREMPQTLDFVERRGAEWDVEIVWLEYDADTAWRRVGPGTNTPASRAGEPFEALIRKKSFLPNQRYRFCTEVLKVNPSIHYMRDWLGYERWHAAIGIRADEAHRAKRRKGERHTVIWPLLRTGVTKREVHAFWDAQPFDLNLPAVNGSTSLGNCDGCFLKSEKTRAWLTRYMPERTDWWAEMEASVVTTAGSAARFDKRRSWRALINHVERQPDWVFDAQADLYRDADLGTCHE